MIFTQEQIERLPGSAVRLRGGWETNLSAEPALYVGRVYCKMRDTEGRIVYANTHCTAHAISKNGADITGVIRWADEQQGAPMDPVNHPPHYTPKEAFTKVLIQSALNVDCEKIAAAMAATDWSWATVNGVPDAQEVRQNLFELVNWLIDNFNGMGLVSDGQTVAQAYSGGWYYIISHWPPSEYRITIGHGHSGQGDNICEQPL